jgi:hypothetical protein
LLTLLGEAEEWLYEEGADLLSNVYDEKSKNMTKDFDKYNKRKSEETKRTQNLKKL